MSEPQQFPPQAFPPKLADNALAGKTILVTGAGDGIGKVAAQTYASFGATVILLGRTVSKLEAVYDAIIAAGHPEPAIVPLDLKGATEQHYQDMAETIAEQFGQLDGVLHNASLLGVMSPFEHQDAAIFNEVMQVNVTAQFLLTKALLPVLRQAPYASVVFTSSGVGRKGRAYWGAYAISKFATEGMMQTLAHECQGSQVFVNSLNPGATRTKMRASAYPAENPMELKTAEEIMPLYVYLMSEQVKQHQGEAFSAQ